MKLIVNADDFGMTKGVTEGILDGMKNGVITDTSAMVNMPYFDEAVKVAKENGLKEMGVHLTVSCGKPLTNSALIKDIVDDKGFFYRRPQERVLNVEEVEIEYRAQINKFLESGLKMNHIDCHHHCYSFYEEVLKMAIKLAKEFNVPMRCPENGQLHFVKEAGVKAPDYFSLDFYDKTVSEDYFIKILEESLGKYEVIEIMCHPAIVDEDLMNITSYNSNRKNELQVLKSEKVKKFIKDNNIELVKFSNI